MVSSARAMAAQQKAEAAEGEEGERRGLGDDRECVVAEGVGEDDLAVAAVVVDVARGDLADAAAADVVAARQRA